jgi:hypothetical protein
MTQTLSLEARAVGVQIYDCKPGKDDPSRFEWIFRAPEADLFDAAGNKIGRHYAGPTWESNDGSKVVGEVKARDDGPDAKAIPWLLLGAKSVSGDGVLGRTASVQRIQTAGGIAPADGCSPSQAGKEARVPYGASIIFIRCTGIQTCGVSAAPRHRSARECPCATRGDERFWCPRGR